MFYGVDEFPCKSIAAAARERHRAARPARAGARDRRVESPSAGPARNARLFGCGAAGGRVKWAPLVGQWDRKVSYGVYSLIEKRKYREGRRRV